MILLRMVKYIKGGEEHLLDIPQGTKVITYIIDKIIMKVLNNNSNNNPLQTDFNYLL